MKTLVVEDTVPAMMATTLILSRYGFEVDKAVDGREAVEKATKGEYALILMDIGLPYIDGIEATRQILAAGTSANIVGLTANLRANPRDKLTACGMKMVYEKPLLPFLIADILYRFRWMAPKNERSLVDKLPAMDSEAEIEIRWDVPLDIAEMVRQEGIEDIRLFKSTLNAGFDCEDWHKLQSDALKLSEAVSKMGTLRLALTSFWLHTVLNEITVNRERVSHYYGLLSDSLDLYLVVYEKEHRH